MTEALDAAPPVLLPLLRAAWYAGGLGAAGLAFVALGGARWLLPEDRTWLRLWARAAAALGLLAGLAGLVAGAARLAGGGPLLDAELWGMLLSGPAGRASALGLAGCLVILAGPAAVAALGGLAVSASHALAGHGAALGPAGQALVALHVAAAAAWLGSLPLLARLARRGGARGAAFLAGWGRAALPGVALLVASGLLLGAWLLGGAAALAGTGYGLGLLAKLAAVGGMLALAARHRLRLVPGLAAGAPGAVLGHSILAQAGLGLVVLAIVALLTGGVLGLPPALR